MKRNAAPARLGVRLGQFVRDIGRFGRLSVLGFSLILPLLGAAVVSPLLTGIQIVALIATAVGFHLFIYVSNDVFDLPVDRTQPLRAGSPLVRGVVQPSHALAIALVPVPLACVVHLALGLPPAAAVVLLSGMVFGLIYNRFAKRLRFPLASDAVQGLGWVALMLYGALASGGPLPGTVAWLGATVFVYVLLVNAFHGGLRDLENDARHGVRSTALYLGVRTTSEGRLMVPRAVIGYGMTLQGLLLLLVTACVVDQSSALRWGSPASITTGVIAAHVPLVWLSRAALRSEATMPERIRAGIAHLFLSIGVVFLPFSCFASPVVALVIVAAYAAPLLVLFPYLGWFALRTRMRRTAVIALISALAVVEPPFRAQPAPPDGPIIRVVAASEIVAAMTLERQKGYDLLATPNGARFAAAVNLEIARHASVEDPLRTPLVLDHRDYLEAFVRVTGVSRREVPTYVRIAFDHGEDQYIDYRQEKVLERIVRGRPPRFAINVVSRWTGPAERYSYEDHDSHPPLRVTHERIASYRLLDFGDMWLFDDIDGVSGRALGGVLGLLFNLIGDAHAVRSFMAMAPDGYQVTVTTARKGPIMLTTTATVDPSGRGEKGLPPRRPDLADLERRLRKPFTAEYVPLQHDDLFRRRRVAAPLR